ncbi:MAG: hypothetical protein N2749_06245 [Clostridia bacterium]|nr:hypothetical protein [Clostridia bacterium]
MNYTKRFNNGDMKIIISNMSDDEYSKHILEYFKIREERVRGYLGYYDFLDYLKEIESDNPIYRIIELSKYFIDHGIDPLDKYYGEYLEYRDKIDWYIMFYNGGI